MHSAFHMHYGYTLRLPYEWGRVAVDFPTDYPGPSRYIAPVSTCHTPP
jgi:hypothetical protein